MPGDPRVQDVSSRLPMSGGLGADRPQDLAPLLPMSAGLGAAARHPRLAGIPTSLQHQILAFVDAPPPGANWFDKGLQITLAASALRSEIVAFQLRGGYVGILRFFANNVQNSSDSSSVTFALLIDGSPVQGYSAIIGPKSPSLSAPDPIILPLLPGNRISVVATNSSSGAIQNVGARIKGWYWPTTLFSEADLQRLQRGA